MKGLYVSPKLFRRQLDELQGARFHTPAFGSILQGGANPRRQVFLTIDDGFTDVLEHALPALRAHGFRAILFLVVDLIGKTSEWQRRDNDVPQPLMDATQIREWIEAGQEIGSHTRSHPYLTRLDLEKAREEIVGSKQRLEDKFGQAVDHFCYPFGDWNPAVRDRVGEAGYRTACTTRPGVNGAEQDPLVLNRFTARYPSRKLSTLWQMMKR
jgi:peptidoglycan/xylan/chitin deacetylase (PgdA/CDA1 family)